jgi:hypothetical protein
MEAKNIDDQLIAAMQDNTVEKKNVESVSAPTPSDPVNDPIQPDELPEAANTTAQPTEALGKTGPVSKPVENKQEPDKTIDEYGNPIEKPKMYSEEEVARVVRERLARAKQPEYVPPQQQYQPQAQEQPAQEEDWEQQLKTVIKKTFAETQQELAQQQWQQQESARQAEFEARFASGMNKYQDFQQVVYGKPITDTMMLAARNLENPAAFVYGAAKMHAPELERISKISDPYAQAAEIGRLHEKMIKSKNVISGSHKPLEAVSSDMPSKTFANQPSIDERIHQYAKQKRR